MKISATSSYPSDHQVFFKTTKTALVGTGDNHYIAAKSVFRRTLRYFANNNDGVEFEYRIRGRRRIFVHNGFAFQNYPNVTFGCMTFFGKEAERLRRWATAKTRKKAA